jgi:hypothetical protein
MTIVLEPSAEEIDFLENEAKRRGIPVERFAGELMRGAILEMLYPEHEPNEETIAAIEEARAGKGKRFASVDELCRDLGIPCER